MQPLQAERTVMKKAEQQSCSYKLHLTPTEYERLKKKAEEAGLRRSDVLRKYINDQPVIDNELRAELRSLDVHLSRIGNNINQIAWKWNESGSDMRDIAYLREQMLDIYRCIREVREYCYKK